MTDEKINGLVVLNFQESISMLHTMYRYIILSYSILLYSDQFFFTKKITFN